MRIVGMLTLLALCFAGQAHAGHGTIRETDTQIVIEYYGDANDKPANTDPGTMPPAAQQRADAESAAKARQEDAARQAEAAENARKQREADQIAAHEDAEAARKAKTKRQRRTSTTSSSGTQEE